MAINLAEDLHGGLIVQQGGYDVAVVGGVLFTHDAQSPSQMAASIMESPLTLEHKDLPLPTSWRGRASTSSRTARR